MTAAQIVKGTRGTVLVIEDNMLNLDMACELLELAGFQTFQAEDAMTGIDLARSIKPDLILMDMYMPNVDGFSATRRLKQDPELRQIPVLAFTALAMREDQEKALEAGCSGIVTKPIDISRFANMVASYIPSPQTTPARTVSLVAKEPQEFVLQSSARLSFSEPSRPEPMASNVLETTDLTLSQPARANVGSQDISAHTVLVVDDNAMNVELLKDALESMGQNVVVAYGGQAALSLAQDKQPDLILLDIMMPDMDGYAVLEHLQANPNTKAIPVIFISALNKTQDMVRGFKQGTYDYITKPFKIEEVKARVLSSLRLKDLQDRLRQERDKMNVIFRFSADGIALLGPDQAVLEANPVFCQWFHMPLTEDGRLAENINFYEVLGCQCDYGVVCPIHTQEFSLLRESEQADGSGIKPVLSSVTVRDETGNLRYLSLHGGKVAEVHEGLSGYVIVLRDMTLEKSIEQSKETFVATLTHDLKTPIRAEHQALDLLASGSFGDLNQEQQEIVQEVLQSNRYMSRLVDSLLATYMYEDGKVELKLEPTDLNAFIQSDVIPPLQTLAQQKSLSLNLNLDADLPNVWVDSIEIQRVLNNLVQNAIHFTPEGGRVTLMTQRHGEEQIMVSVQDSGEGIEPENRAALFDRYKTMAKKFKQVGTGLGLYLSRMIVEAHGGSLDLESEVGRGSRFFFILPINPNPKSTHLVGA